MNVDEAPTPRESSSADRGRFFRTLAAQHARSLDRLADDALRTGPGHPRARLLAGRFLGLVEAFDAWARGEATIEQRESDVARWRTALADARELGIG